MLALPEKGPRNADERSMGSINHLSNSYLQSILNSTLQGSGLTANTAANSPGSASLGSQDNSQLSPFAQLLTTLQQLEQSNPTQYKQVTAQIATNLESAAKTAQSEGNTAAATELNQLSTDFTNASTSGQLPNIQDLAQATGATGAHGHHHHHHHASSSDANSSSSDSSSSTANTTSASSTDPLSQLLSAFQTNANQSNSLNPMNIILNTLSNAGISTSNT